MKKRFWHRGENIECRLIRFLGMVTFLVFVVTVTGGRHFKSGLAWWTLNSPTVYAQQPVPTPTVDRLAIPVLPENPTQLDIGRSVYYHNCMPCHGDIGQGLTDEWREVWVDDHQNCWARGCHAGRETDLGFPIPTTVPAVIGDSARMYHFPNEDALFSYISQEHPPQNPGVLEVDESRAVTAFLISENGRDDIEIKAAPKTGNRIGLYIVGVSVALICILLVLFIIFRSKREKNSLDRDGAM